MDSTLRTERNDEMREARKELIERLRELAGVGNIFGLDDVSKATKEAADLIERQATQIEMMKDTLSRIMGGVSNMGHYERARKALSTTPNEALQAFAEKVREQAAQVIESQDVDPSFKHRTADAIRSITELPK